MKLKLGPVASDVVITIYVIVTLTLRMLIEMNANLSFINSLVLGISFLLILIIPIKLKILNPAWFGLLNLNRKNDEI